MSTEKFPRTEADGQAERRSNGAAKRGEWLKFVTSNPHEDELVGPFYGIAGSLISDKRINSRLEHELRQVQDEANGYGKDWRTRGRGFAPRTEQTTIELGEAAQVEAAQTGEQAAEQAVQTSQQDAVEQDVRVLETAGK